MPIKFFQSKYELSIIFNLTRQSLTLEGLLHSVLQVLKCYFYGKGK